MLGLLLRGYDFVYRWRHGLTDPAAAVGPALRVEVTRHRGRTLVLADGTPIRRGDRIGILHLNNEHVAALHDGGSRSRVAGLRFRRSFEESLGELGRQAAEGGRYAGVEAFMAETILHSGTERAGFEVRRLGSRGRLVGLYERTLLAHYHPLGKGRARRLRSREARAIWISRRELLRRYGAASSVPSGTSS